MGLIMKKFFEVDAIYRVKKNIKDILEWSDTFIPGEEVTYCGYTIDRDQGNYIYIFDDVNGAVKSIIENPDEQPFSTYEDYFAKIGVNPNPAKDEGLYMFDDSE